MKFIQNIVSLWSATEFNKGELTHYAEHYIEDEVRNGIMTLAVVSLLLLGAAATLYALLGFSTAYVYTFTLLALLALHIAVSTRFITAAPMLYMLGMTLLIIAGTAFVLLAHKTGAFSAALLSSTVLLFMVVPLVPWGLREAALVVSLIYIVFTLSTLSAYDRFGDQTIWLLQFLMLGSGMTTLIVVARSVSIRKHDIKSRFELEGAHREMELLSYKDPLTGAWNRRFLEKEFLNIVSCYQKNNLPLNFVIIDIDNFKNMNDLHGHVFGDSALQYLAKTSLTQLDNNGYLFRMGGDEFALLFQHEHPVDVIEAIIKELHLIPNPHDKNETEVKMYISAGLINVSATQTVSLDLIYKQADKVLYQAKNNGNELSDRSHIVAEPYIYRICPG